MSRTEQRHAPHNFLFRGNNPVTNKVFNLTALIDVMRQQGAKECGVTLPAAFQVIDIDLENPTDPGYFSELTFWKAHRDAGEVRGWPLLGSLLDAQHCGGEAHRDALVKSGAWAIAKDADKLPSRLAAVRELLTNTSGPPRILFAHCNAGCDRTGEFIGSYAMRYLGYNATTAYGEACKQCGRCPNYYATNALKWWCLTLQEQEHVPGLGDCLDFAECKFLGACDAHSPTPLANACPSLAAV